VAHSQFDQFLHEATCPAQESEKALDQDSFYGLYTSWCLLAETTPQAEPTLWAAIEQRVAPGARLRVTGPAAADYILASYPAVI
jgi:hypothetical protein